MNGIRMSDEELTAAYQEYGDMVYRIALVQTKQQALAEDIQQEVFLALVRHSDRIRSEEHLKAWLIRVTQNACRKHFRSLWVKLTVFYDDRLRKNTGQEEEDGFETGEIAEETADPEEETEMADLAREAVEQLPERYRIPIHLFYYEELSVKEIARITGNSESNVKTQLSRARSRLKEIIGGMKV